MEKDPTNIKEESKQEESKEEIILAQNKQKFYINQELDCLDELKQWLNVEVIAVNISHHK